MDFLFAGLGAYRGGKRKTRFMAKQAARSGHHHDRRADRAVRHRQARHGHPPAPWKPPYSIGQPDGPLFILRVTDRRRSVACRPLARTLHLPQWQLPGGLVPGQHRPDGQSDPVQRPVPDEPGRHQRPAADVPHQRQAVLRVGHRSGMVARRQAARLLLPDQRHRPARQQPGLVRRQHRRHRPAPAHPLGATGRRPGQLVPRRHADRLLYGAAAYSPDGTSIAFTQAPVNGSAELYTMKSDGSNVAPLTNSPDRWESRPNWGTAVWTPRG
ncbi:hypothetical protein MCM47_28750 [Kitasatospora sp. A2-31]|nr:hypothetical protein [Kitasatospora sp. A2-31]